MTQEEHDYMIELCVKIKNELNQKRFGELVDELNDLLEQKSEMTQPNDKPN
jgi:hypothetical protein